MLSKRKIFDESHNMFRESVKRFVNKHVVPYHTEWEKKGIVSRDFWLEAGAAGILCPNVPEEYGGSGADFRYNVIIVEEFMKVGATGPGISVHSDIVTPYILHYGTESQKSSWLPGMCEGRLVGAIAMTEPGTGSDLQSVKTNAKINSFQATTKVMIPVETIPGDAKGIAIFLKISDISL